ncbi:sortase (surface protein transpeptidase) [Catenulispora sp. GP43]|uniref:class F sortase n=1 Tax=Catenulispora sp. GP43 TaxID=3156263 RepID=UPI00351239BC
MASSRTSDGGRLHMAAAAVCALAAILLFHGAKSAPQPPPQPPASADQPLPGTVPGDPLIAMPASNPVRVEIPDVGIDAPVVGVGQTRDGELAVPSPARARSAGWFTQSAAPGSFGDSVIIAHVDSRLVPTGKAAFYHLGSVRPHDTVYVDRADHTTAVFTVDSVEVARKSQFPAAKVYGPVGYAALRLITCGGGWSKETSYDSNVIVYAHLIRTGTSALAADG